MKDDASTRCMAPSTRWPADENVDLHTMSIIDLAESLLFEAEGPTLDFKREQYRFVGAGDQEKAELLKDILAFANAFRRAEAYIFIGAEEVQGGRSTVVGVVEHLEDADLQQFVNSKTNRPVDFSYRALELGGKKVALIRIALQKRPLYLTKNYGGLSKDIVYIRHGSSTAIASPDEIAQMGVAVSAAHDSIRALTFLLGDGISRSIVQQPATFNRTRIVLPTDLEIPDFEREQDTDPLRTIHTTRTRREFLRELVDYYSVRDFVVPIGFAVRNDGPAPGLNVDATVEVDDPDDELTVIVDDDLPEFPKPTEQIYGIPDVRFRHDDPNRDVEVRKVGAHWHVEVKFGKIRPKETVWTAYKMCIGAPSSRSITLRIHLHGDNIPDPISSELTMEFTVADLPETLKTLIRRYVDEAKADADADDEI